MNHAMTLFRYKFFPNYMLYTPIVESQSDKLCSKWYEMFEWSDNIVPIISKSLDTRREWDKKKNKNKRERKQKDVETKKETRPRDVQ